MPCFLLSIWSGTEWEDITENTFSPMKAVSEQARFGNLYLAMILDLAPVLLKLGKAVIEASCVFVPLSLQLFPSIEVLHIEQAQAVQREYAVRSCRRRA